MGLRKTKRNKIIACENFTVSVKQHGDNVEIETLFIAPGLNYSSNCETLRITSNTYTAMHNEFCRFGDKTTKAARSDMNYDYTDIVMKLEEAVKALRATNKANNADIPEVEEKPKYKTFLIPSLTGKIDAFPAIETINTTTANGRYVRISHDGDNVLIQVNRIDPEQKIPAIYEMLLSQETFKIALSGLCEIYRLINKSARIDPGVNWKIQRKELERADQ